MILETKRLLLRPWEERDAAELYRYASEPEIGLAAGFQPHKSVEDSLNIIRNVLSEPETYAVILKETGLPVGSVGIMPSRCSMADEGDLEIGYWIGKPYWGRGLIPEVVRCLQERCFVELGSKRVWYGYYDGNERSKRVQEKCGFSHFCTEKDVVCTLLHCVRDEHFTCITCDEWKKSAAVEIFWQRFIDESGLGNEVRYTEAFHFEMEEKSADYLLELVMSGKKCATSSAFAGYSVDGSDLPKVGDLSIVTDFAGYPFCIIQTEKVSIIPFSQMTFEICSREGEDDTLESWQEKHRRFFISEGCECGYEFYEDMPIVFEDFRVIYKKER